MNIKDKSFVAIEYTLTLDSGEQADKSEPGKPLCFIFNSGQMIPGLEKQIEDKPEGFTTQFVVEPVDGYGETQEELVRKFERKNFPEDIDLKPGMVFQTGGPEGKIPFRVKSVDGDMVTADFNHPLSGEKLHFDLKVVEVREATPEELASTSSECEGESSCSSCCGSC